MNRKQAQKGGALLMAVAAACFVLAAGQAFAEMKECEPDDTCFNVICEQMGGSYNLCAVLGPGTGGMTSSGCGQPPCQARPVEKNPCFTEGCEEMRVMICEDWPVEPCLTTVQHCGEVRTGKCQSTRVCTTDGCPEGQSRCTCTYGQCQPDEESTPCTPMGCGLTGL